MKGVKMSKLILKVNGSNIIKLHRDDKPVGTVWFLRNTNQWFWTLHASDKPVRGSSQSKDGACTDLVGAYWKHVDSNPAFPETQEW